MGKVLACFRHLQAAQHTYPPFEKFHTPPLHWLVSLTHPKAESAMPYITTPQNNFIPTLFSKMLVPELVFSKKLVKSCSKLVLDCIM